MLVHARPTDANLATRPPFEAMLDSIRDQLVQHYCEGSSLLACYVERGRGHTKTDVHLRWNQVTAHDAHDLACNLVHPCHAELCVGEQVVCSSDSLDAVHTLDQDLLHLSRARTPPLHIEDRGDLLQVVLYPVVH